MEAADPGTQRQWLFLESSQEFRGCWQVDSLWPEWFLELEDIVGSYRLVTPARLDSFIHTAEKLGYKIVFIEPPERILEEYVNWNKEPAVKIQSTLPSTKRGMLPWQVIGFNKLVKDESIRAGYVVWDTGSGKTAFIASAVKFHMEVGHSFNIALVVVKAHNKIATQRKLLQLGGIDSYIIDGTIEKRYNIYEQIQEDLKAGRRVIAITNYEKFRDDKAAFKHLLKRQECLFFWDEMPTKLSNRDTKLYKAVKESLYISFYSRPRTKWARHWVLTATPIENSPEDVFSCVHLVWPGLLGSVREFFDIHVMGINPLTRKPLAWKNLDHLEAKMSFMTHRVSKEDPEVAKMFPETSQEPAPIDWNPKHRAVYDRLTGKAHDILIEFDDINILSMIQVMQMVCDAPSMIKESAKNRERFIAMLELEQDFTGPVGSEAAVRLASCVNPRHLTDVGHTKLDTWREIIVEKHPGDKIVTHSTWASYIFPIWTYWLNKWKVSYVVYTGTDKQKQDALDQFRNDSSVRVFLSGDSGADSIDIPEAKVGVNYNVPWKWTTLKQREGRRDRVNSNFDCIFTYTLIMPDSVDERKLEICERKHQYHQAIFDGRAHDEAISAKMTKKDLQYILTGNLDY